MNNPTLRDVIRLYNEHGVAGLKVSRGVGRRCGRSPEQLKQVAGWVEAGPECGAEAPLRLRLRDIARQISDVFGVRYSVEGVRKLLHRLGFRYVSPRPLRPRADLTAQQDFRKEFSSLASAAACEAVAGPIELWFQDTSRAGQKDMHTLVWARKGSGPRIPCASR